VFWTPPALNTSGTRPRRPTGAAAFVKAASGPALAAALSTCLALASTAFARTPPSPEAVSPVALAALPPEARQTKDLILAGGPFPYRKDGTVFFNRERLLPPRDRGHYREYTVRTPGSPDRGARRIVCGGERPARPEVCYYTADHYASFRRITR
jgi:ribonuclease T1